MATLEDAEKRRKKTEYQRLWRARKSQDAVAEPIIDKPVLVVNLDNIQPLKRKPKKAKTIPLKDNTINTYVSKLRAFHRRMTGLELSDDMINAINGNEYDKQKIQAEFKYLYDRTDYIIEKELKTIPTLCKIFTKFTGFVKLIKILTPIKRAVETAESVRRNEATIKEENIISFDKQDLLKNANEMLTDNNEKIMFLLMTLIPTRRLDDYRNMTYGKSEGSEGNYFDNENMYIKDTNTKNKKSIIIKIPNEIIDLLPDNGFILGNEYKQSALSVKFSSVMEKIYKKKIGALDLRRMYLTTINRSGASFIERKNIADAAGHSVEESLKYAVKVQGQPQAQGEEQF